MAERMVRNGAVELAVRRFGTGRRHVVFVHGFGSNLLTWTPLIERLREDYTLVAYDRRGHGRSSNAEDHSIDCLADDLASVITDQNLAKPILVGHSVGSWETLTYAAQRHDVEAVICLDQAIACADPLWRQTYRTKPQQIPEEHVCTESELDGLMIEARAHYGALWPVYEPIWWRNVVPCPDGTFRIRPSVRAVELIRRGWASVSEEPYDAIQCPIVVALAAQNTGPIHDMFHRLVQRRRFAMTMIDSDHDIQILRTSAVVDLIRAVG